MPDVDAQPAVPKGMRSALIVARPWVDHLAHGRKRWELRSGQTRKRELVGLIAARTGTVIGVARIIDCGGPFTLAELGSLEHLHLVPPDLLAQNPKWRWAWVIDEARLLAEPVVYQHPRGAQAWVTIGSATALRIARQLDLERQAPACAPHPEPPAGERPAKNTPAAVSHPRAGSATALPTTSKLRIL